MISNNLVKNDKKDPIISKTISYKNDQKSINLLEYKSNDSTKPKFINHKFESMKSSISYFSKDLNQKNSNFKIEDHSQANLNKRKKHTITNYRPDSNKESNIL